MQAQQTFDVGTFISDPSTKVGSYGEYDIYPLQYCSEDAVAHLFAKTCQRRNPLLQGRPQEDLVLLGRAIYRKTLPLGISQVAMYRGEPVALNTIWDLAEGGAWKGSGLETPESLQAHAEVAKACFGRLADADAEEGNPDSGMPTVFAAFGGVAAPHDGKLFGKMGLAGIYLAKEMGYERSFQYTVLASLIGRSEGKDAFKRSKVMRTLKPVHFAEIESESDATRADLKELDGISRMSVTHLSFMCSDPYMQLVAMAVKAEDSEEISVPAREWSRSQSDIMSRSRYAPVSSRL